jgi:sodium-independent sulfate anion transporter 11
LPFFSQRNTPAYVEKDPTVGEWVQSVAPTAAKTKRYLKNLFPFLDWLPRYNWVWFLGDLIAGVTVGAVVVPQSMAYASLAQLSPQFGLYSSFVGVLIYFFFATSKEYVVFSGFFLVALSPAACALVHARSLLASLIVEKRD